MDNLMGYKIFDPIDSINVFGALQFLFPRGHTACLVRRNRQKAWLAFEKHSAESNLKHLDLCR